MDILEDAREVDGLKAAISICAVDCEAIITAPTGCVRVLKVAKKFME
jgi:hypothetical protein